jgi:hypothetical protein
MRFTPPQKRNKEGRTESVCASAEEKEFSLSKEERSYVFLELGI